MSTSEEKGESLARRQVGKIEGSSVENISTREDQVSASGISRESEEEAERFLAALRLNVDVNFANELEDSAEKEQALAELFSRATGYQLLILSVKEAKKEHPEPYPSRAEAIKDLLQKLSDNIQKKREITHAEIGAEDQQSIIEDLENTLLEKEEISYLSEGGIVKRLSVKPEELSSFVHGESVNKIHAELKNKEVKITPQLFIRRIEQTITARGFVVRDESGVETEIYKEQKSPKAPSFKQKIQAFFGNIANDDPRRSFLLGKIMFYLNGQCKLTVFGEENIGEMKNLAEDLNKQFGAEIEVVLGDPRAWVGPILGKSEDEDRY